MESARFTSEWRNPLETGVLGESNVVVDVDDGLLMLADHAWLH